MVRQPVTATSRRRLVPAASALALAVAAAVTANAQDTQLLWGDLHLHTSYSSDAYITGNRSVTPDMAYRYARGLPIVQAGTGIRIRIARPLDFLAVTDHAMNMGIDAFARRSDEFLSTTEGGRALLELRAGSEEWTGGRGRGGRGGANPNAEAMQRDTTSSEFRSRVWSDEVAAAEANYLPGEFATFIAWEWTSMVDQPLKNLHRCVISDADAIAGNGFIPFAIPGSVHRTHATAIQDGLQQVSPP